MRHCAVCDTELAPQADYCDMCGRATLRLHIQQGAIVASLAECVRDTPYLSIGIAGGVLIGAGLFLLGWRLGFAAGVLQPWIDARGWIALLFMAIGCPIVGIWYSNTKGV